MLPNTPDCDYYRGEKTFTADEITAFKQSYESYKTVDYEHNWNKTHTSIGTPIKSWQLTEDTSMPGLDGKIHIYPTGSWFVTTEVNDPTIIEKIDKGEITGYSPHIVERSNADNKQAMKSRDLIKDLKDPVCFGIGLVKHPCMNSHLCKLHESKKNKGEKQMSFNEKLDEILNLKLGEKIEAMKSNGEEGEPEENPTNTNEGEENTPTNTTPEDPPAPDYNKQIETLQEEVKTLKEENKKIIENISEQVKEVTKSAVTETLENTVNEKLEAYKNIQQTNNQTNNQTSTSNQIPPKNDGATNTDKPKKSVYEIMGRTATGTRKGNIIEQLGGK